MIDALITGKLIKAPTIKTGSSGKPYCNFMLSVPTGDEPVVVSGIAFGDVAERIGRLKKGDALSVAGSLKPTQWADKTTGELKHGLNVTVSAAMSAYDIKKRHGSTESTDNETLPSVKPDYGNKRPYNDPILF